LRIGYQLIDAKTQNLLWKGAFDLKYEKLLTVEDGLTQQIIRELAVPLSPSEAEHLKPDQAISPLAYEYYLRGVDLYSRYSRRKLARRSAWQSDANLRGLWKSFKPSRQR
jgi:hypothetical protein